MSGFLGVQSADASLCGPRSATVSACSQLIRVCFQLGHLRIFGLPDRKLNVVWNADQLNGEYVLRMAVVHTFEDGIRRRLKSESALACSSMCYTEISGQSFGKLCEEYGPQPADNDQFGANSCGRLRASGWHAGSACCGRYAAGARLVVAQPVASDAPRARRRRLRRDGCALAGGRPALCGYLRPQTALDLFDLRIGLAASRRPGRRHPHAGDALHAGDRAAAVCAWLAALRALGRCDRAGAVSGLRQQPELPGPNV